MFSFIINIYINMRMHYTHMYRYMGNISLRKWTKSTENWYGYWIYCKKKKLLIFINIENKNLWTISKGTCIWFISFPNINNKHIWSKNNPLIMFFTCWRMRAYKKYFIYVCVYYLSTLLTVTLYIFLFKYGSAEYIFLMFPLFLSSSISFAFKVYV